MILAEVVFLSWAFAAAKAALTSSSNAVGFAPTNLRVVGFTAKGVHVAWDHATLITVEDPDPPEEKFQLRYRLAGSRDPWRVVTTRSKEAFLYLQTSSQYEAAVSAPSTVGEGSVKYGVYRPEAPWSSQITINVPSSVPYRVPESLRVPLRPPQDVRVRTMSTTSVHVEWSPPATLAEQNAASLYYEIQIQKYEHGRDQFGPMHLVRVSGTSINLDGLRPGATYKFRLVARTSDYASEPSTFIIQQLPTDLEGINIRNLRISSNPTLPDQIALSWTAEPQEVLERVTGFVVHFTEDLHSENWRTSRVYGTNLTSRVVGVRPNTLYYLKVETQFDNGAKSESNVFRFKTAPAEPILNIEVNYDTDGKIRIRWILNGFVNSTDLIGYKVVVTDNDRLPETEWNVINVEGREAIVHLESLRPNTKYAVKIHPKQSNGTYITSRNIFNFLTFDQLPMTAQVDPSVVVHYRRLTPTSVKISWNSPHNHTEDITGYMILYTADETQPESEWRKIVVPRRNQTELDLVVEANRPYYVKIVPRSSAGYMPSAGVHRILDDEATSRRVRVKRRAVILPTSKILHKSSGSGFGGKRGNSRRN